MPIVEYAVDVWDLRGVERKPDAAAVLKHLNEFGGEGWELVWLAFNVELARDGESHLFVFKRAAS